MTKVPGGLSGVNNYSTSEPRKNVSAQSNNLGAPIKRTVMPAAATHAGHGQVNPGSTKSSTSVPSYNKGLATEKHAATATQLGKKQTGHP